MAGPCAVFKSYVNLGEVAIRGVKAGSAPDPDGTLVPMQENLRYVLRHARKLPDGSPSVHLALSRDRENPHDPNAVRVMATVDDCALAQFGFGRAGADALRPARVQVGWVPREMAGAVAAVLDSPDPRERASACFLAGKAWFEGPGGETSSEWWPGAAPMAGARISIVLDDPLGLSGAASHAGPRAAA